MEPMRFRVLFTTNSEHGQANAVFAIAHELLIRGDVDVHLATFSDIGPRIDQVNRRAKRAAPDTATELHSHWFGPGSMYQSWLKRPDVQGSHDEALKLLLHEPGFFGLWDAYGRMAEILQAWTADEYLSIIDDVKKCIHELKPDVVVVDGLLSMGIDAATITGVQWIFLTPNSFKDVAGPYQDKGEALWKIPSFGTGWDFPLSWWQIPLNILLQMRFLCALLFSTQGKEISKALKTIGLSGTPTILNKYSVPFIIPMTPEMDYPIRVPANMHGCGPFLLPSEPVHEVDAELANWIQRGPLVLINRGSHITFSDKTARRMIQGLLMLRDQRPDVRVLWKLRRELDITDATFEDLKRDLETDMVRIVPWLKPDPLAILRSGQVICVVNHGGANSCLEAISTGVPQLVIPGWADCWDWATRIDYLKVGVWGNRRAGLSLDGKELGEAFIHICKEPKDGELDIARKDSQRSNSKPGQSNNVRVNAQELALRAGAPGSKKAMDLILQHAQAAQGNRSTKLSEQNSEDPGDV